MDATRSLAGHLMGTNPFDKHILTLYVLVLFFSQIALMPLPQAVELNRTAIARIIAGLFALLGLTSGSPIGPISRTRHRMILFVLRPAESAVRRLIVFMAASMKAKALKPRPMPSGIVCTGQGQQRPRFQLFDPRPRIFAAPRRPKTKPRGHPRITFFGDGEVRTISLGREPRLPKDNGADGQANSANLLRRLEAVKTALDDLPRQANRLVRALARRQKMPRLRLKGPLRPGRAPGWRRRPREEIDHVLHQCDWLAREALPDTS